MDTVECPVCSGTFSVANIVIHASTCGIGANNVSNMNGKKRKLSSAEEDSQPATSSGNGKSFSIFSQTKKTKTNDATSTGIKTREPESHQAKRSDPEVGKKRKLDIPLAERMRPTLDGKVLLHDLLGSALLRRWCDFDRMPLAVC